MPRHAPYSTVEGDVWALGCILAEMIANVRPWTVASPEDRSYTEYLVDRTMLYDMLPISDGAYTLFTKIFSSRPECRPSLAVLRVTGGSARDGDVLRQRRRGGEMGTEGAG